MYKFKIKLPKPIGDTIGKFKILINYQGQPYYQWAEKEYYLFAANHNNPWGKPSDFSSGRGVVTILLNNIYQPIGKWRQITKNLVTIKLTVSNEEYLLLGDLSKLESVDIYLSDKNH